MTSLGRSIGMWCPYVKAKLGSSVGKGAEAKEPLREEEPGRGKNRGPGKGGSPRERRLVRGSRALWISVLGLALLALGYWLFYYGSRLKYLPKYHTIVLMSGANGMIMHMGAWLTVAGVCAIGVGGVVEIIRRLRGRHRGMHPKVALVVCTAYFTYMVTLALLTLAKESPWPWFFLATPVTAYLVLVYDRVNRLR